MVIGVKKFESLVRPGADASQDAFIYNFAPRAQKNDSATRQASNGEPRVPWPPSKAAAPSGRPLAPEASFPFPGLSRFRR